MPLSTISASRSTGIPPLRSYRPAARPGFPLNCSSAHIPLPIRILIILLLSAVPDAMHADTLFVNARFHILDDAGTISDALHVRNGRVLAHGSEHALSPAASGAVRIDLGNRDVYPGFIDAHAHLFGLGQEHRQLRLLGTPDAASVITLVRERAASTRPGEWIRGRGWDQNDWPGKSYPTRTELDAVDGGHPVFLQRVDGHAAWVNSRALVLAGIGPGTPDPPGGRIHRDASGEPTGILIDNAVDLVKRAIPPPTIEERMDAYRGAIRACLAKGLTGMHDMGVLGDDIIALRTLIERGEFPFRIAAYIDGTGGDWEALLASGRTVTGSDQLVLAGLKLYADGALGSRGALLHAEYADDPGNAGLRMISRDEIAREAARAIDAGLQVCIHAIGDGANTLVLDGYADALRGRSPVYPLRVEHVQVLRSDDIPRFAALGVIPSMQPTHCTSDMPWAERRLGPERVRGAYAWRSLLDAGAWIPGGSDFPVERPDPLAGMHAASTRRTPAGVPSTNADIEAHFELAAESRPDPERYQHGWYGSQRMRRDEAVKAFTRWAARAAGMEHAVGSLEPGRYADFVILDADPLRAAETELAGITVLSTWVGGTRVFHAE